MGTPLYQIETASRGTLGGTLQQSRKISFVPIQRHLASFVVDQKFVRRPRKRFQVNDAPYGLWIDTRLSPICFVAGIGSLPRF